MSGLSSNSVSTSTCLWRAFALSVACFYSFRNFVHSCDHFVSTFVINIFVNNNNKTLNK